VGVTHDGVMGVTWGRAVPVIAAGILLLGGCSAPPVTPAAQAAPAPMFYVSIGDSYAAGFRPKPGGGSETTRDGFAYQVADRGGYTLANFGCAGMTSRDLLIQRGCAEGSLGPGAAPFPDSTQTQAARDFLRLHAEDVALITVVVGGNDVLDCFPDPSRDFTPETRTCLDTTLRSLEANLRSILSEVRAAAGPGVTIVGLTYPDVFLGAYVRGGEGGRAFALSSQAVFRDRLNPMLRSVYAAAGAKFVDITDASGGYGPFRSTSDVPPYGVVPEPVAQVCRLTFYCESGDPHPRTIGHALIADGIVRAITPG
jgi:lysophospholipase L1-like esterase